MKLTRETMRAALERAASERREREARGEREPLDDWPDGPPLGDAEGERRYYAALQEWCGKRGVPYPAPEPSHTPAQCKAPGTIKHRGP